MSRVEKAREVLKRIDNQLLSPQPDHLVTEELRDYKVNIAEMVEDPATMTDLDEMIVLDAEELLDTLEGKVDPEGL